MLKAIPKPLVSQVVVCDNGSVDGTAEAARKNGAVVVSEPEKGYGNACLAGIRYLKSLPEAEQPDVVVFLDGDYSDFPQDLPYVVGPILISDKDMVIGSRLLGSLPPGAMTIPQRLGNWLSGQLIWLLYGMRFTDLGPFRAIRWPCLLALDMQDRNFGWTAEMQVKAAKHGLKCTEVSVRYRPRIAGKSKVSGTLQGAFRAAYKILWVIFSEAFRKKTA